MGYKRLLPLLILAILAWGAMLWASVPAQAQEELRYFIDASRDQISYIEERMREFGASVKTDLFRAVKDGRWHIEIAQNRLKDMLKEEVQTNILKNEILVSVNDAINSINDINIGAIETAKGYVEEAIDDLIATIKDATIEGLIDPDSASQMAGIADQIHNGIDETDTLLKGSQSVIDGIKRTLSDAKGEIEAAIAADNDQDIKYHAREARWKLLGIQRELRRVLGAEEVILQGINKERMALSSLTGPLLMNLASLRPGFDPLLDIREEIVYEFEDARSDLWEFQGGVQDSLGKTVWRAKLATEGGLSDIDKDNDIDPQCPYGDLDGDGQRETCMKEALNIIDNLDLGGIIYVKADMENIIGELLSLINKAEDDGLISPSQAAPLRERLEVILAYLVKVEGEITTAKVYMDEAIDNLDDAMLTFIHCTYDEAGGRVCGDDPDGSEAQQRRLIREDLREANWLSKKAVKVELELLEDLKYMHANLALFLIVFLRGFLGGQPPAGSGMGPAAESLALTELTLVPNPASNRARFTAVGQGIASIKVQVFDLAGRRVFESDFVPGNTLEWPLVNSRGEALANGIYLYIVILRGPDGKTLKSRVEKLVLLR